MRRLVLLISFARQERSKTVAARKWMDDDAPRMAWALAISVTQHSDSGPAEGDEYFPVLAGPTLQTTES